MSRYGTRASRKLGVPWVEPKEGPARVTRAGAVRWAASLASVPVWAGVHSRATGWDGVLRERILRASGEISPAEKLRIAD